MNNLRIRSASGQLAEHLKEEIRAGRWTERMPGETWLVTNLQVGRDTVRAALAQLEEEGLLVSHGPGKRRQIVTSQKASIVKSIRLRIFLYEREDRRDIDNSSLLAELLAAGIDAGFADQSLKDLGMDVDRVARYVKRNPADAWVVSAASREVLEWFAGQATPVIAMYGRHKGIPIASAHTIMIPGMIAAVRRLIELGHKRIVMITREERRKPRLSRPEQAFLDELEAAGIKTGEYNLPDWKESQQGLRRLLDELFRHSPPTALIFQEAPLFVAARTYLADRGVAAPRGVSMVVADHDASFVWSDPIPCHIRWDYRPVVRRVVRWARNVAQGKDDRRQSGTEAKFVEGGTIGPVPGRVGG
jgi:LacI family transcriptional regulator